LRAEPFSGYLAADGYEQPLAEELGSHCAKIGRLFLRYGPPLPAAWALNLWRNPIVIDVSSISDAARKLRALQRNWAGYHVHLFRRAALIQEQLPRVSARPIAFPAPVAKAAMGSWSILSKDVIVASPDCSSPFPNGEPVFIQDHLAPPSRAYLKLWEALILIGSMPGPGDRVLDLGASPGSWTWVLQRLVRGEVQGERKTGPSAADSAPDNADRPGKHGVRQGEVVSVDKAPLEPRIAALPGVVYLPESAFSLDPATIGPVDWLFSDVVCYPSRLLKLVHKFMASGTVRDFLCSVKFQGATDHRVAAELAAIPGSRLQHLHNNGHELTWVRLQQWTA